MNDVSHIIPEKAKDQVTETGKSLLKEAGRIYRQKGKLTDEILSALHHIYQGSLLSALELVDKEAVSRISSPSGRFVYQVVGSSGTPYTNLASSLYCSCPAFTYSVLHKEDHIMCKHLLAVQLSNITDKTRAQTATDQQMADLLSFID